MGTVIIRFEDYESDAIKAAAKAEQRSINSWCKLQLLTASEKALLAVKPAINVNIQPGEDIIVQKRNSKGRFEKKS